MNQIYIEGLGYLAAAASVFVYLSNTMIPLRIAAILANGLFAGYFFLKGLYPMFALNAMLLPVNVFRLQQMRALIDDMRQASREALHGGEFDTEWLRPVMRPLKLGKGFTLHTKNDVAEEAFVLLSGEIHLVEPDVTLTKGAFFGEMGMFTDENRRTATAIATTDVELLCVRYDDLAQLTVQNPQFGFYLMRLMVSRMQHNVELARAHTTS